MKIPPRIGLLAMIAAGLALVPSHMPAQTLLLGYTFNQNGSGTTAPSTGSNTSSLNLINTAGAATNLHGTAGSGVSGQSGDLAFDNSASTGMGSVGTGGRAETSLSPSVGTLSSFTLQGWFKTDGSVIGDGARLLENYSGSDGFRLYGNSGGLALQVDGNTAFGTANGYNATSTWTFFAVTYDGTLTSNNVNFYIGSTSSSVSLVQTLTINSGSVTSSASLSIGNSISGNSRSFDGLLDNFRVYGETSGSGGVLSQSQLESLRVADAAIPEPSTAGLLGGVFAMIIVFGVRKRRSHQKK